MKKYLPFFIFFILVAVNAGAGEKRVPLKSGEYKFRYCDIEYENPICFDGLDVKILGQEIWVSNNTDNLTGPKGLMEHGTLFWHKGTQQWIIITKPEDKSAAEIGGCSDGPRTINLKSRTFESC
jgi:hypothetical protein